MSKSNRHHYVPQFYLRQFCCSDDVNKVSTASRNGSFIVMSKKSIKRIGYEDKLYAISNQEIEYCIEEKLNQSIETPISQSNTWAKVRDKKPELIDEADKLTLYLFMRHLEARNLELLHLVENEIAMSNDPVFRKRRTVEEREMHSYIKSMSDGPVRFFHELSENVERFMLDYPKVSISIFKSNIPLRTSTNPVITLPESLNCQSDGDVIAKWLPLSHEFGVMMHVTENYNSFGAISIIDDDSVRVLNRQYLVQLLSSHSVRHMIVDDDF